MAYRESRWPHERVHPVRSSILLRANALTPRSRSIREISRLSRVGTLWGVIAVKSPTENLNLDSVGGDPLGCLKDRCASFYIPAQPTAVARPVDIRLATGSHVPSASTERRKKCPFLFTL